MAVEKGGSSSANADSGEAKMDSEATPTLPHMIPTSPPTRTSAATTTAGMDGIFAERMVGGGGALCNDQNGLCLGFRGNIDASKSGIYTSIAKLAAQLDSTVDGESYSGNETPLVSIHTEQAALLVKEYGGRTVVFRVPTAKRESQIIQPAETEVQNDGSTTNLQPDKGS